jgi:hypothetical protein
MNTEVVCVCTGRMVLVGIGIVTVLAGLRVCSVHSIQGFISLKLGSATKATALEIIRAVQD